MMEHVRSVLADLIADGQGTGDFRDDLAPAAMAEFLMTVKAGILTAGKVNMPGMAPYTTIETALQGLRPA